MALTQTDMPLAELTGYRPDVAEPADFDDFWQRTLLASRQAASPPVISSAGALITELITEDLTFSGFNGEPVRAWIVRPASEEPLPTIVRYVGYGGGRGAVSEHLAWAAAGFAHIVMDTRGQGSMWGGGGDTADDHGAGPATPGFMTRGILSPETYYYRRVFTDAVRLVDTAAELPFVDASRIAVTGVSQGGGISLATAALSGHVRALMPDVAFLCHFARSISHTPEGPFPEITRFLSIHRDETDNVMKTLSYFDGVNFARRIDAPSLFSVGLMDDVVLPSSVFAAFNALNADDAHIEVYPFNGHEGGALAHWDRQVEWIRARFGA